MHRRSFGDGGGAVGLRIVIGSGPAREGSPTPPRSDPIPIRPGVGPTVEGSEEDEDEEEDMEEEMAESYTCVTSHVGGMAVRKRVYFDDGTGGKYGRRSGVFFESSLPGAGAGVGPTSPGGFLSRCCLCRKKLHGLDIFMYRGDKAFCSVECRSQQILSDENKERCRSDEAVEPFGYSVSPYPSPLLFAAGVAAA